MRLTAHLANTLPVLAQDRFWRATNLQQEGDITWHGAQPNRPDWSATSCHLAYELVPPAGSERVLVLMNAETAAQSFALVPPPEATQWHVVIDTGATAPDDVRPEASLPHPVGAILTVPSHTVVVLMTRPLKG